MGWQDLLMGALLGGALLYVASWILSVDRGTARCGSCRKNGGAEPACGGCSGGPAAQTRDLAHGGAVCGCGGHGTGSGCGANASGQAPKGS